MIEDYTGSRMLNEAADLIETYGWTQGEMGDCKTGFCMVGALDHIYDKAYEASGAYGVPIRAYLSAETLLVAQINTTAIPFWNDDPNRTKEEVVAALRAAAEKSQE